METGEVPFAEAYPGEKLNYDGSSTEIITNRDMFDFDAQRRMAL
jgi:hypothetical protein